jgi:uncharacterized membrane protein
MIKVDEEEGRVDHSTAVMILINAMQSDKSREDIEKEIQDLLEAVTPEEREPVLKEASEQYKRLEAGLPFDQDAG